MHAPSVLFPMNRIPASALWPGANYGMVGRELFGGCALGRNSLLRKGTTIENQAP
jgi:hypothetical protein